MDTVLSLIHFVFWAYTLIIIGRFVADLVGSFVPDWKPSVFMATVINVIYRLTDPLFNLIREIINPVLRFGSVRIDFSFIIILVLLGLIERGLFYLL